MAFVLDASATLSWIMPGQSTRAGEAIDEAMIRDHAIAPSIWRYEVVSVLSRSLSAGVLEREMLEIFFRELDALDIRVEAADGSMLELLQVAQAHRLSAYDAAYLQLAMAKRLPLATLDVELARAAQAQGLFVIGVE